MKTAGAAVLLSLLPMFAWADDSHLALRQPPEVAKDLPAFPRLVGASKIIVKVNDALAGADARARKAAASCRADAHQLADWSRSIEVTLNSAHFISFVAHDSYFCGGAYPDTSTIALVYDLKTGAPVDWKKLLPADLTAQSDIDTAADGTRLGTISSPKLVALFAAAAKAQGTDPDCKDALTSQPLQFLVWPNGKAGGLAVETPSLPHVVKACAPDLTIPAAQLKAMGADAVLIEDIETNKSQAR